MSYFCNFLGTSAAQAIAADDYVEQCPTGVTVQPVSLPDPTTMRQLIRESAVTSGRGKGKISGKRIIMIWLSDTSIAYRCTT